MSEFNFFGSLVDDLTLKKEIADQIISMRQSLNLTQRDLAAKTGIKQPQIARIESGKYSPRLNTLNLIASSLGYRLEIKFVHIDQNKGV